MPLTPTDIELIESAKVAVAELGGDVRAEQKTRARQVKLLKWALVAAAVLALAGGTVNGLLLLKVRNQADQLAGSRIADCERGNVSRAAILELVDVVAEAGPEAVLKALGSATVGSRSPEQQAIVDDILAKAQANAQATVAEKTALARAALAPRDCSSSAVNP